MSRLADHLRRTLVIVDDSPRFIALMREMLQQLGFSDIHTFSTPEDAYACVTSRHVDLILTDLGMEPVNGFQLADRVRHGEDVVNRVVPIILMTGHAGRQNMQRAIVHGVDEILVKPVSIRHLHDRLIGVFDRPRVYVKTPSGYFGPDRRRHNDPNYRGPERRKTVSADVFSSEQLIAMRNGNQAAQQRPVAVPSAAAPTFGIPVTTIHFRSEAERHGQSSAEAGQSGGLGPTPLSQPVTPIVHVGLRKPAQPA